ncbi:hypothetical protein FACS1894161_0620 [Spirochaetia bacterium]|nr:hypothetical protein FACS1894161_0620 [Spirochaetia bacterium]
MNFTAAAVVLKKHNEAACEVTQSRQEVSGKGNVSLYREQQFEKAGEEGGRAQRKPEHFAVQAERKTAPAGFLVAKGQDITADGVKQYCQKIKG